MTQFELALPRFISSRDAARQLVDRLGAVAGHVVTVNARNLRSASPSSVDEIVSYTLLRKHVAALLVVAADDPDFNRDLDDAVVTHGVQEKVRHVSAR